MKSETGNDNRIVLTVEANPLALCTSRLDGSERHRVVLDRDAAVSLAGAIMVVAQHEHLQRTGKLKEQTANTGAEHAQPIFAMRTGVN